MLVILVAQPCMVSGSSEAEPPGNKGRLRPVHAGTRRSRGKDSRDLQISPSPTHRGITNLAVLPLGKRVAAGWLNGCPTHASNAVASVAIAACENRRMQCKREAKRSGSKKEAKITSSPAGPGKPACGKMWWSTSRLASRALSPAPPGLSRPHRLPPGR